MTITDQIKILDDRIKSHQAQYHLGREAANISALSSIDLLDKYEHLTSEDLGHKPSAFEKAKFEYFLLGISLSKALKKDEAKSVVKSKSDFNYDSNYICFEFSKSFDEFEEMPLGFSIR